MNLDEVIKEYEQLKFESDKPEINDKRTFPHIVSKDSFEKLIMSAEHNEKNTMPTVVYHNQPIESSNSLQSALSQNRTDLHPSSHTNNPVNKQNDTQMFQQTSVITSNSSVRNTTNELRKRSIHRQRNVDESAITDVQKEGDKNNNERRSMSIDNTNTCEEVKYRPYRMIPYSSFDKDYKTQHAQPGMLKSKSLEIPDDEHPFERNASLPKRYNSFHYEEETARRYLKSLNITGTNPPHYSHGSTHGSPHESMSRENSLTRDGSLSRDSSFSDSPTSTLNNSPMGNLSPLRRLQEHEMTQTLNKSNAPNFNQSNSRHKNMIQSNPIHQMHISRSYESQQAIHHKYTQRKAYSVNSAPYDIIHRENNMRRIFSEEIVPEHPNINNETRTAVQQHMRRAASYDLASYVRHGKPNRTEKLSGSVGNFHQQSTGKPATKILFPQHDNVKDYKNIFITHIDDEATHARNVMENSKLFKNTNNIDFVNYFNNSIKNYHFLEDEKKKMKNETKNKMKLQNSQDNLVIGPYQYDASFDDELAVCVTGLLTLPGSNEKRYPITVGELRRRIAPPEYLNKVDMISYVRLAKTSARELLEKHQIRPKHHSRKSKHSVISKMCEAECTEFATGVKMLSEAYFPKEYIARESIANIMEETDEDKRKKELAEKMKRVETTRSVLQELATLLEANKSTDQMQNYNLATHSYGLQSLTNNISLISTALESQSNEINRTLTNKNTVNDTAAMETEESMSASDNRSKAV